MKNHGILKRIFSILLILSVLTLAACGDDDGGISMTIGSGEKNYEEEAALYGISYTVPDGFEHIKVTTSEFTYTDGVAELDFRHFDSEGLEEQGADPEATVLQYTRMFCIWNDIPMTSYTYDEEKDIGEIKFVYEINDADFSMAEYFHWTIRRGSHYLYVVSASCPPDEAENYYATFDAWHDSISVK